MENHDPTDSLEGNTSVDLFLVNLETIPWFANIGSPMQAGAGCKRILSWREWLGPEEPSVTAIGLWQGKFYEELIAESTSNQVSEIWQVIHEIVVRRASEKVPYNAEQDAWHGPTAAVWNAAYTAGLMGLCLYLNHKAPPELEQQWRWYIAGHWPCDWDGEFPEGSPIIY